MRRARRLLGLLWILSSAVACQPTQTLVPSASASPLLGLPAPVIDGRSLDGVLLTPAAYADRPVVVEFFAEYCLPCRETLPAVAKVHAREAERVAFIGISLDEYASNAQAMAASHGLRFPVIHDGGKLRGRFRVDTLPATFVIDRSGTVVWAQVGASSDLERELRAVLRGL